MNNKIKCNSCNKYVNVLCVTHRVIIIITYYFVKARIINPTILSQYRGTKILRYFCHIAWFLNRLCCCRYTGRTSLHPSAVTAGRLSLGACWITFFFAKRRLLVKPKNKIPPATAVPKKSHHKNPRLKYCKHLFTIYILVLILHINQHNLPSFICGIICGSSFAFHTPFLADDRMNIAGTKVTKTILS